ncbi:damage-control phosphatase ARMT1 family protein [Aspergillus affinis]|uniref:damage-control phosphatase ARMT1 family protein n=1 Tax=Aspergillus affinis TaxID=1070780 RepID=UPI0022FED29B|nr:Cytochrome c oxidase subunit Va family protein [Aspergillus affinis]KAI9036534.1 Cytochrome c oxidase subunit Va family protein [Aspergillus affinis]
MEHDPSIEGYCTSDESSFAYTSAHDRWSIILTGAIADISETSNTLEDPDARAKGERIIKGLRNLQFEIQSDAKLTPLYDDGSAEIADYNKELGQRNPSWLNVFWLYGECYLYRRIRSLFLMSTKWKNYDVFAHQKSSTFQASKPAILELAARYKTVVQSASALVQDRSSEALLFQEMCEICLWGNATDMSLLTSLTYEDIQKLQGSEARKTQAKNVLINDIPAAFDVLDNARREKRGGAQVDIVLDNPGFKLYVDLLLAGFLLSTGLATKVVLHPKSIPWFVSDAMHADFTNLLSWRLPHLAPGLFIELKESDLVIFKGDLNYRKLTGDDTTTLFPTAIGPLGTSWGVRTLALRTCKADVVVGLAEGEDERLRSA